MRHVGAFVPALALNTMNFLELRVDERNLSDSKVANLNLALGRKVFVRNGILINIFHVKEI